MKMKKTDNKKITMNIGASVNPSTLKIPFK